MDIMKKHGANWRSMSLPARADYERRAKASQAELTITNDNDAANLRSDIEASQQKVAELHSSSVAMSVLGCRFTSAEVVLFQEALESPDYAVFRSKDLLAQKLATKVGPPPEHIRDLLASVVLPPPAKVRQIRPNWVRLLATHRSFFQNSIFRFDRLDGSRFAKFTLAKQCPLLVGMCEVTPLPQDVVMPDHLGWTFDQMHTWEHSFTIHYEQMLFTDAWPLDVALPVHVLTECVHIGDGVVASDVAWQPLTTVAELLPPVSAHVEDDALDENTTPEKNHEVWYDCPWLNDFVASGKMAYDDEVLGKPGDRQGLNPKRTYEADAMHIMDALAAARDALAERELCVSDEFKWRVRGGALVHKVDAKLFDICEGFARSGIATDMCDRFHMSVTYSCAAKRYGEEGSFQLVCGWCHKMQFLLDKWVAGGDDALAVDAALIGYVEPDGIRRLFAEAEPFTVRRVSHLRGLHPRV